jgi:uncharacterized membrane protein
MRPPILAFLTTLAAAGAPALAQSPAPAQPIVPQQIACRGEEPFWHLQANRSTGVLENLGGSKARQVVEFRGELLPLSHLSPKALVWRGASTHLPSQTVVATLREEACASTMKDGPALAWRAILTSRAGEAIAGCCSVKSGYDAQKAPLAAFAQKRADDWSRRYPELAPSIQRCVNEGGVAVREVAKAWQADGATVAVRMLASDGKAYACTVDPTARVKPKVAPVAAGDPPLDGANAPAWYPPREAPVVACGRLERIAGPGARARTEGWLHYDRC